MRNQSWVGAVRDHGCGLTLFSAPQRQCSFSQGVIGPLRGWARAFGVTASPWLQAGVQVEHATGSTKDHERQTAHVDGQIQQKVAADQQTVEDLHVVVFGERSLLLLYAPLPCPCCTPGAGVEHHHLFGPYLDVPEQQRHHRLCNSAPSDDQQPAMKGLCGAVFHGSKIGYLGTV